MTNTYNTGNPLGSTSPKDLYDNASNFDEGMNSPSPSFVDRFGKRRETWTGFEAIIAQAVANLGFQFIGNYDSGPLTITSGNQVFGKDGEFWKPGPDLVLPYTTVENWAIDQSKFLSVGDAVLRSDLAAPTGTDLIGDGTRNLTDKLDEIKSVLDFGADSTGVGDASAAFSAYIQAQPSAVTTYPPYDTIARAPISIGRIPAGTYRLNTMVDTGGKDVIWIADSGAKFLGDPDNLNGKLERPGSRVNDKTHIGALDYACTFSVQGGMPLEAPAGVLGIVNASDLSTYTDRDTVGLYAANMAPPLLAETSAGNYTGTSVTVVGGLTDAQIRKLRVGMIVDTKHSPKYSGFITGWAADGSVINVSSWYLAGGGGAPATPANGVGIRVNPFTKAWAMNANLWVDPTSYANAGVAFELGVGNNKLDYDPATNTNNYWCYDAITVGTKLCETAYMQRGYFFKGYESRGATGYAFIAKNEGTTYQSFATFCSQTSSAVQFVVQPPQYAGQASFLLGVGGNIDMGRTDAAADVVLDMHSSGGGSDYDVRLRSSGGSGTAGQGNLFIEAAAVRLSNGYYFDPTTMRPLVDSTRNLGDPAYRYNTVYAANGVNTVSDARKKTAVREMTDDEIAASKAIIKEIGFFRFLAEIKEKGLGLTPENCGTTVQRVMEIMREHRLEPLNYGFICYDKWEREVIHHPAVYMEQVSEDCLSTMPGERMTAAYDEVKEAGDCYGFRVDQLNMFLLRGLEARISALESV